VSKTDAAARGCLRTAVRFRGGVGMAAQLLRTYSPETRLWA
jgi:hypothetical protein